MNQDTFVCNLCTYRSDNLEDFNNHYIRRHQHDPNFHITCCIGDCGFSTSRWNSFRVHVHRKHREFLNSKIDVTGMMSKIKVQSC